jgi:asparagine synthase (glutamine-hydrolysing)
MVPAPDCVFERVVRLQPGEYVEWRDGALTHSRYWSMRFDETATADFPSLKNNFLTSLRDGVRGALGPGKNGAFLSGGTDSSTIAGLMGEIQGARAHARWLRGEGLRRDGYARIAARRFGTDHHEYYVTADDIVELVPSSAAYDQPLGTLRRSHYYCARLAKDGVDHDRRRQHDESGRNARYAK